MKEYRVLPTVRFQRASWLLSLALTACGTAEQGDSSALSLAGSSAAGSRAGSAAVSGSGAGTFAAQGQAGRAGSAPGLSGAAGATSAIAGSSGSVGTTAPGNQTPGLAGRSGSQPGLAGAGAPAAGTGAAGSGSAGGAAAASGETGRMVGMTAAHNAVRARTRLANNPAPSPALPPLTWSSELAGIAQAYADKLAGGDCQLVHSMVPGLGENLAYYGGQMATAEKAVEGWAAEEQCYTFGTFMRDDVCDMTCTDKQFSNGCGHYTQLIWRKTSEVGCGVAICKSTGQQRFSEEIWVCNYRAPGNYVGQKAY